MTHFQRIVEHITARPGMCDDCLAVELKISRRQTVYRLCSTNQQIHRNYEACVACEKVKITRSLADQPELIKPLPPRTKSSSKPGNGYLREADLQKVFNDSVATSLGIEFKDYYGSLDFEGLLRLKQGYARIHDIITLKLTLALVDWIAERFDLSPIDRGALRHSINLTHPNASGFDLDCTKPNIIGEVKGCIPVNRGETFGAAQLRGLTNDVLQMLGRPPRGKDVSALSKKSKIRRENRPESFKFLALYDSPEVRAATAKWKQSLIKDLGVPAIQDLPDVDELSPDTIYLVFLNPAKGQAQLANLP